MDKYLKYKQKYLKLKGGAVKDAEAQDAEAQEAEAQSILDKELIKTAFSYYYLSENTNKVQQLLNNGANIDARDEEGKTPLIHASIMGNKKIVEILLEILLNRYHEDKKEQKYYESINAKDKEEKTPLIHASIMGKKEIVEKLLYYGANIEARDKEEKTPLIHASIMGKKEIVEKLLYYGANIEAQDKEEKTPIIHAFDNKQKSIFQSIAEHYLNKNLVNLDPTITNKDPYREKSRKDFDDMIEKYPSVKDYLDKNYEISNIESSGMFILTPKNSSYF
jgi:ankyrin repeat protein